MAHKHEEIARTYLWNEHGRGGNVVRGLDALCRLLEKVELQEREACAKVAEKVTEIEVIDVVALPTSSAELARKINDAWRKSGAFIASAIRERV